MPTLTLPLNVKTSTVANTIPVLKGPGDNTSFHGFNAVLKWQRAGALGPNEFYDVLVGPDKEHLVSLANRKEEYYSISWDKLGGGKQVWTIRVVERVNDKVTQILSPTAVPWSFWWNQPAGECQCSSVDFDEDTWRAGDCPNCDCDDRNPAFHPGAIDPPRDGKDWNCDDSD